MNNFSETKKEKKKVMKVISVRGLQRTIYVYNLEIGNTGLA